MNNDNFPVSMVSTSIISKAMISQGLCLKKTIASMKHYKRLVVLLLTPIHRQQKETA